MQWFRFYHEFMDDPKIAMMSDSDQLIWVKALCLASANEKNRGYIELSDDEICWKLRISAESWKHAIDKFRAKGMIEHCDCGYRICNWSKRQFSSDSSAERVARHRAKKSAKGKRTKEKALHETAELQPCNVTVTPPDPDPDSDPDPEDFSRASGSCPGGEQAEARGEKESLRSQEPNPEPAPGNPPPSVQSTAVNQLVQQGGVNVPPQPAAQNLPPELFARRGVPHVVPIQAQFQGPWGVGYTEDLRRFESWLLAHKSKGKDNPSAWLAAVVNGIAKGGSRALWDEFQRYEAGEAAPVKERSPAMKKFLGIA